MYAIRSYYEDERLGQRVAQQGLQRHAAGRQRHTHNARHDHQSASLLKNPVVVRPVKTLEADLRGTISDVPQEQARQTKELGDIV